MTWKEHAALIRAIPVCGESAIAFGGVAFNIFRSGDSTFRVREVEGERLAWLATISGADAAARFLWTEVEHANEGEAR